jgi:transposase-like protein
MTLMSERQWKRQDAVARVAAGKLTMAEAAQVLGVSVRQVRRIRRRVERHGAAGVAHGNRGRVPVNKLPAAVRARMLRLRRTTYQDFNDQHFTEKLALRTPPLQASVRTVRRVLRTAGIAAPRQRRAVKHRRRRERRAQAGLMLLWDGSRHEWLEGRGPTLCLMAAIDDATGELLPGAHFVTQECAAGYLHVLQAILHAYGRPWSIYMDQHGALKRNDDHWTFAEEQRGRQDPTQVGAALQALEIEAIFALSPQAKGRVERLWGTLQDRLVSELRLAGAATLADANAVLTRYRPEHNQRFTVAAAECTPAWRPLRRGHDLARLCSFRYEATVLKDNTVRLGGHILDIPAGPRGRSYADRRVEVRQLLDGSWRVYLANMLLATGAATAPTELRALRRRKHGRGAPAGAPAPACLVVAAT